MAGNAAEFVLDVSPDGTVNWQTGTIPDQHHDMADKFQEELEAMLGGPVVRKHRAGKAGHVHTHGGEQHQHTHEGE